MRNTPLQSPFSSPTCSLLRIIQPAGFYPFLACPFLRVTRPGASCWSPYLFPHALAHPPWPPRSLQKMRESGLRDKLVKKWFVMGQRPCERDTVITAGLSDVAAIFILLMGGAAFSCLLLLLERAVGGGVGVYAVRTHVTPAKGLLTELHLIWRYTAYIFCPWTTITTINTKNNPFISVQSPPCFFLQVPHVARR